ncbi:BRCT domain-containing protein [Roseateles sp. BYS87W]|uniref:BRCT domain-containing protein n=1 Tax=Pelomonas baiyunensis TaxID=3299026 RepID=A0ABW7H457_9BURK
MNPDVRGYFRFTRKDRVEKSINTLIGLLEGIGIDGKVSSGEVSMLRMWLEDHADVAAQHPFNELVPAITGAIEDGVVDSEEHADLLWLCRRLQNPEFLSLVTADLQRLHAVVGGIAADGVISVEEMRGLSDWLQEHEHLKTCWPYDEIETLTTKVLSDGRIDAAEHQMLLDFFMEFLAVLDERTIERPLVLDEARQAMSALCAVAPEVSFDGKAFCFTGASSKFRRAEFEAVVSELGGQAQQNVTASLDYLVIGAEGNPCWAFACYGRKVEKAVALRRKGVRIVLVHENDFHDALMDAR